jgi:16S rRNA (uracil1498-N3)-methyltransferase
VTLPVFLVEPGTLVAAPAQVRLDGDEGRHASVVRRVAAGERVLLADGAGVVAACTVRAADRGGLTCEVHEVRSEPPPQPRLVVVQALPKGDRGEVAVATLTEVGVDVVVPWSAARCVVQWRGERADRAVRRWRATARESGKQARRAWLPVVEDVASTEQVVPRLAAAALPVVLHESAARSLAELTVPGTGDVVVVVGPEGGLTDAELNAFGVAPVRVGPHVLRTSTAGTVAAAALLARSPRWR